jgi:hypothetical protein
VMVIHILDIVEYCDADYFGSDYFGCPCSIFVMVGRAILWKSIV